MTAPTITPEVEAQRQQAKTEATLRAQLALRGFSVYEVVGGGFFVGHWTHTKFCPALADLEAFARQVGAS